MLAIASDHGGFALKQEIMAHLKDTGVEFEDLGTYSEESVDYPVYAAKLGKAVAAGEFERGILICGTGIGISIAANKIHGVRCALCSDCYSAEMSRRHNNANVLAMGGRTLGVELAKKITDTFLHTDFEGGRHERRVNLIMALETEQ
ncbi:MAG: ribose 5-phosphate isomerase B [Oscillospiraceae bacterium]|nr:ribose 5-phosphate isomerase B [Oscillospiraceae bacterium]